MRESHFIPANTQCPQKPRGRKRTKPVQPEHTSEPATRAARKPRGFKDQTSVEQPEQEAEPRRGRANKRSIADAAETGRPSAAACGFSTVGLTDAHIQERLAANAGNPEPESKRTKKQRRNAGGPGDKEVEPKEGVPSKCSKVSRKKVGRGAEAPSVNEETTKRRRKAAQRTNAKVEENKSSASASASGRAPANAETDRHREPPQTEAVAKAAARAAAKAKASRKSAAYHKAAKEAKIQSKTKDEIAAAGKAVSWITCFLQFNWQSLSSLLCVCVWVRKAYRATE